MRIASFDVGVINLSFIVFDIIDGTVNIVIWKNINLITEDSVENMCCQAITKKGSLCNAKNVTHNGTSYLCKRHTPIETVDQTNMKTTKATKATKATKTKKKPTEIELSVKLVKVLDSIPELKTVNHIIIERQPYRPMGLLGSQIYTYFIIRVIVPAESSDVKIEYIHPKYKLQVYNGKPVHSDRKTKYARNKQTAIEHCKYFLEKYHPKELDLFLSRAQKKNKMDDYADCFLQGYHYIVNRLKLIKLIYPGATGADATGAGADAGTSGMQKKKFKYRRRIRR